MEAGETEDSMKDGEEKMIIDFLKKKEGDY